MGRGHARPGRPPAAFSRYGCYSRTVARRIVTLATGRVPPAGVRVRDIAAAQRIAWTLLYYTGSTRLAKNILQPVLGRYLDRDRRAMATLAEIEALARGQASGRVQR